jgi:hypothetical protein
MPVQNSPNTKFTQQLNELIDSNIQNDRFGFRAGLWHKRQRTNEENYIEFLL